MDLLSQNGIYPAFHMNKRYWISVALDDTLSDEEVLKLIEKSWNLTLKSKEISLNFQILSIGKIFSTEEIFRKYCIFS